MINKGGNKKNGPTLHKQHRAKIYINANHLNRRKAEEDKNMITNKGNIDPPPQIKYKGMAATSNRLQTLNGLSPVSSKTQRQGGFRG